MDVFNLVHIMKKDQSIIFQENTIDLSDIVVDENYYENALRNYVFKETFLNIYLNRYEQLELSQDDKEEVAGTIKREF